MSIFNTIFNAVKSIVAGVSGGGSIVDLMIQTVLKLPSLINEVKAFIGGDAKIKIDEGLLGFDELTGTDANALGLIKTLPDDKEEEAMDHFKEFMRIVLYNQAKVPGYYVEE